MPADAFAALGRFNNDMLIVPSLEAGALMLRMLTGMFGALAAGIVLGAKVPVVLAARGDSMEIRMAGCVLASLMAQIPKAAAAQPAPVTEAARVATKRLQAAECAQECVLGCVRGVLGIAEGAVAHVVDLARLTPVDEEPVGRAQSTK